MKLIRKALAAGFCIASSLGLLAIPVQSQNNEVMEETLEVMECYVDRDPMNNETAKSESEEVNEHQEEDVVEGENEFSSGCYRPNDDPDPDHALYLRAIPEYDHDFFYEVPAYTRTESHTSQTGLPEDYEEYDDEVDAIIEDAERIESTDDVEIDPELEEPWLLEEDWQLSDDNMEGNENGRAILEAPHPSEDASPVSPFEEKLGALMSENESKGNPLQIPAAIMAVVSEDAIAIEEQKKEEERLAKEKAEEEERQRKEEEKRQREANAIRFDLNPNFDNLEVWQHPDSPYHKLRLWGQCTWFAWHRFYEIYGFNPGFRNRGAVAAYQLVDAHPDQFELSKDPKAGAVFSYENHTGLILQVNDDGTMIFQDGNYDGVTNHDWNQAIQDWKTNTVKIEDFKRQYPGVVFANPTFKEVMLK